MSPLPHDKQLHLGVGAAIALAGCLAAWLVLDGIPFATSYAALIGLVLCTMAGVGKELYDQKHADIHDAEVADAVATLAGGSLGTLAFLAVRLSALLLP